MGVDSTMSDNTVDPSHAQAQAQAQSQEISSFPPLAAVFLTHFDDIKGQSVVFYQSISEDLLPPGSIEHTTLPSGLHLIDSDLILFTHGGRPGCGLFRSRDTGEGRGKRMATVGVVLASTRTETLFELQQPLAAIYDRLETFGGAPFGPGDASLTTSLLTSLWESSRSPGLFNDPASTPNPRPFTSVSTSLPSPINTPDHPVHPITYLPALLGLLGPAIVTLYKAAVSGQRVLLYSAPPLLPLGAFAWCVNAMAQPPVGAQHAVQSRWLGNIGLMDLDRVGKLKGGWVATTSDAIYRSHPAAYDLFIDLSSSLHVSDDHPSPSSSSPAILTATSRSSPGSKPTTVSVSYAFSDLPLYRALVMLDRSPSSVTASTADATRLGVGTGGVPISETAGVWLLLFALAERLWALCVGVCEFAVGRGRVGEIALGEGDEDARHLLLGDDGVPFVEDDDEEDEEGDVDEEGGFSGVGGDGEGVRSRRRAAKLRRLGEEDDASRRGRLLLRQFHHNTYHLYWRLLSARRSSGTSAGNAALKLTDKEVATLCGVRKVFGAGAEEGRWWQRLAETWGVVGGESVEGEEGQDLD